MFGMCLAVAGIVMAPVPLIGPGMSGAGAWLCWKGRRSEFARGAWICFWINLVACAVGVAATVWFINRHW